MNRFVLSLATTVAAIALAPAANATICIGVSINGGAISNVGCDGGTGTVNYNATTGGFFYNVSATGSPLLAMPQLLTQSVNIRREASNATVDLYITQQDMTSMNGGLLSTFTSNTIQGATAAMRSYYSASNALWGGTLLATGPTFNSVGTYQEADLFNVTGPWSETVRYTLTFNGGVGSNFNGTANLTAVPEPATWGLMLLGFGAMGGMLRSRRRPAARIRFA